MVTTQIITSKRPCIQCGGLVIKKKSDQTCCHKCLHERERQDGLYRTAFRDRKIIAVAT